MGEHTICVVVGSCEDSITVKKVDAADPADQLGKKDGVINWFNKEGYFSIWDTFGALMGNPPYGGYCGQDHGPGLHQLRRYSGVRQR